MLCKEANFTPEYVESITPVERQLFWNQHKSIEEERNTKDDGGQHFDPLSPDLPPMGNFNG